MSLAKLLASQKSVIVRQWFDLVIKTYPSDTQQFFKSQKDPFANPVGQTTFNGLQSLFGEILKGIDRETVWPLLDPIVRIRAVQNFSPSEAVAFILDLKIIIRKVAGKALFAEPVLTDWIAFEHQVDALTLIGFDLYMTCREKIFALKADNERTKVLKAFTRAGLITGDLETESHPTTAR